ncbi:hypothetical protein KP509_07G071800 [Ceratopteris richardii]|uniref:Reverse transcriptase domain-containing protein n=1 Tax=Ceratopteris richardii TaxID=49495 RepID=A0A8T2UDG9_CERRI|nr:hypothetical protein KP509_07G071800 [Ceratopteris richardii]
MVDSKADSTTISSLLSSQENSIWNELLSMLNCKDLWGYIGGHTLRYTFHSRSHKTAMSRLDRCYYSHIATLNAASRMWIDATMLLLDHNPLLIFLKEVDWNACIPTDLSRIPLRVNHLWLKTYFFKSKVQNLIEQVISLKVSPCMKWDFFVTKMKEVIRDCGKLFSKTLQSARIEAESIIFLMTEKIDCGHILAGEEYDHLCKAYRCLEVLENHAIQASKVKARCIKVNDLHANSKCFYDFLRAKRVKDTISQLEVDGNIINDGNSMAACSVEHFQQLFAASYTLDDAWFTSIHESLKYTPLTLDFNTPAACEKSIFEEEVHMALQSLKNGKAPGIDGITKEFVIAFWPSLKGLILEVCNEIWRDQRMPYSFKLGKIKLIPKLEVPKRIKDGRPITMMSIIYKIFAEIFALRLKCIIHKVVHPSQIGFIHQRSIYDNIFLTQMLLEHAASSSQEAIGIQLDFEKAFDLIRWEFIAIVLKKLGFGTKVCRLIYTLAQGGASHIEINGRLSPPVPIERSVQQGCPLSPLFYALASSPMFYLLETKMASRSIHGISIHGVQQIAVGFADDTFIFAKADMENVQNIMDSLVPFSQASGLRINKEKLVILNIFASLFRSLNWEGPKIEKGNIFRHLGYPLGIQVTVKEKVEWVLRRIKTWEYVCQPKATGGLGILHAHSHLMERREAFVMHITTLHAPIWTHIFWTLVENGHVNFKGSWKLDAWNKFFSHAPLQTSSHTLNFLLGHFKLALSTLKWNGRHRYIGNSFAALSPYWSLSNPPIAYSLGPAARYFNNKGIDSIAKCYNSKWELLSFPTVRRIFALGQGYKFKWLQIISFLQEYQVPLSIDASDP